MPDDPPSEDLAWRFSVTYELMSVDRVRPDGSGTDTLLDRNWLDDIRSPPISLSGSLSSDSEAVPQEVIDFIARLEAPIIIIQRTFEPGGAIDTSMHRPVVGGVSVGAARFVPTGNFPLGTLGAVGLTITTDPPITIGLSNHHVLAHDANRAFGDHIIQPEPTPFGQLPNDLIGTLLSWEFPEIVYSGIADAAICSIDVPVLAEIADLGSATDTASAFIGMQVKKRGRTTGVTYGIVTTDHTGELLGTYYLPYLNLPPVNGPTGTPTVYRQLTKQIQVMIDFPLSSVWSENGDSGSVVVDPDNNIVGLHFARAFRSDGDPIAYGLMTPISVVEQALGDRGA